MAAIAAVVQAPRERGVKGAFPGGCDIVRETFGSGELRSYIAEKGIASENA